MNKSAPPCPCPVGTHHECSICLELICPGHLQSGTTVCSECNDLHQDKLQRDQHGRVIDPVKQTSILTCICGRIMTGTDPCTYFGLRGSPDHRPIKVPEN